MVPTVIAFDVTPGALAVTAAPAIPRLPATDPMRVESEIKTTAALVKTRVLRLLVMPSPCE
jgi:hypothetical protein